MSTTAVSLDVKEQVQLLRQSPVLMEASNALASIPETVVITSDEEDAQLGDLALKAKKGVRHIETGLTDLFRPMKTFEKLMREHFNTNMKAPLEAAVAKIDRASLAYRQEKGRAAREAQERAEAAAREAARIATEEAAARAAEAAAAEAEGRVLTQAEADDVDEFDVAPGVAQVIAPPLERIARGEDAATFERRTLRCSLEEEKDARLGWPGAFLFDEREALEQFKRFQSMRDVPTTQDALDAGVVIDGVRFYNEVTIQRRAR